MNKDLMKGLVLWHKMTEGVGSKLHDVGPYHSNGILLNAVPWVTGHGVDFDGLSQYATFGNDASLNFGPNQDFTVVFEFKCFAASPFAGVFLIYKGADILNELGWAISMGGTESTGRVALWLSNGTSRLSTEIPESDAYNDNEWHILIATFDRDGVMRISVDNKAEINPEDISSFAAVDLTNAIDLTLARRPTGPAYYDGSIRNLRVYNRLLSFSEQIQLRRGRLY